MISIPGFTLKKTLYESVRTQVLAGTRDSDGTAVIVKLLNKQYPSLTELANFRHEYEILRLVSGEGIVRAYGIQKYSNTLFIVMEDFGGVTLGAYCDQKQPQIEEKLGILIDVATILGNVHAARIMHKDVNPSNILLGSDSGELRLIDFGIATRLSRQQTTIENPTVIDGTLAYMSPEQSGRMNRNIDYRTDFYSLGATAYFLLTGRPPFETTDPMELIHSHIALEPTPPHRVRPEIPEAVSAVLAKMMQKTAEARYQSAAGIVKDLTRCRVEMQTTGKITYFVPGEHDTSERFQIPQKLYGRDTEIGDLLSGFERASRGEKVLVVVTGAPGIGKSSIVNEINWRIAKRRGYCASGKFDQFQRNVPYSAFIQAFSDLVRQLMTESVEAIESWKTKLTEAVGPNGRLITDVIPEVELIVGAQPEVPAVAPAEAQNRFNLVFQRFVGVFATEEHPLALFLDDLQWADVSSLNLIELLVTKHVSRHLLIIGAYRDAEVDAAHPLTLLLDAVSKKQIPVQRIPLASLEPEHVRQLVAETLLRDESECASLADLLHKKTNGNPFFLNQFFTALYEDGLLSFDSTLGRWVWNLAEIESREQTVNVVELMTGRIRKLGADAQRALQLAACIGGSFELQTLATVLGKSPSSAGRDILAAVEEDLVRPVGASYKVLHGESDIENASFNFLHDRVQQAAYELIPADEVAAIHLSVGRQLLGVAEDGAQGDRLFDVVNHLNFGRDLITDVDEKRTLLRLNLDAGTKAKSATAYGPSVEYLTVARSLVDEVVWDSSRDLALRVYREAAEAAFLNTDFEMAEELVSVLLQRADTAVDKAQAYLISTWSYMAQHRMLEAVDAAREGLKHLGVSLPREPGIPAILLGAVRTKMALRGKTVEDLLALPAMTDPAKKTAMKLLADATTPAYFALPKLHPFFSYSLIKLSLQYGNAPISAFGYLVWGVLLCGPLKDIEGGYRFGELALELVNRFDAAELKGRANMIFHFAIKTWKDHYRDSLDAFLDAYQRSLEAGDVMYVALNANSYCIFSLFAGVELDGLSTEMERFTNVIRDIKQETHLLSNEVFAQVVENLRGTAPSTTLLSGRYVNEKERLPQLLEAGDTGNTNMLYLCKTILGYLFGEHDRALENAREFDKNPDALASTLYVPQHYFYYSLALLASHDELPAADARDALKKVASNQKKLRYWSKHASRNYRHKYDLVEAERARVTGDATRALALYDTALEGARLEQFVHEEALAAELAGKFHLEAGRTRIAQLYLRDARHAYLVWGARAKVDQLDATYPDLLGLERKPDIDIYDQSAVSIDRRGTGGHGLDLDLSTAIKASQSLSGQIVLEQLMRSMMKIVLENAGAQRGVLILDEDGSLQIEAVGEAGRELTSVLESLPADDNEMLPASLVNYVVRTRQYVVLDDASTEGLFTEDPYVVEQRPKSVLCVPLLNQGTVTGLLYLENNLTTGAFTRNRIELLRLLSSQIAISIQNARLYNNLEEKVAKRTEELRESNNELNLAYQNLTKTQARLVQSEKMASLGQLTAGIAHEIRNPLNFVNNFSEVSVELVDDLVKEVEAVRENLPADALEEIDVLIEDLKSNARVVLEHGKRAESIVGGMLQHSRIGQGDRQVTNLNRLLDDHVKLSFHGMVAQHGEFDVTINTDLDESIKPMSIFPQEIGRVFVNLVGNALDALREYAATMDESFVPVISVSTRMESDSVRVTISDNGPGIPEEIRDKVFEPFFTTKPTGSGTGLGLSMSYDIVTNGHGGSLRLESKEGEGATFVVTLPLS